jgi:hypothetical protein
VQQEEIIQLHSFLFQVRLILEEVNGQDVKEFVSYYESLNVSPHHVHRSKDNQKEAVLELCKGIFKLFDIGMVGK